MTEKVTDWIKHYRLSSERVSPRHRAYEIISELSHWLDDPLVVVGPSFVSSSRLIIKTHIDRAMVCQIVSSSGRYVSRRVRGAMAIHVFTLPSVKYWGMWYYRLGYADSGGIVQAYVGKYSMKILCLAPNKGKGRKPCQILPSFHTAIFKTVTRISEPYIERLLLVMVSEGRLLGRHSESPYHFKMFWDPAVGLRSQLIRARGLEGCS